MSILRGLTIITAFVGGLSLNISNAFAVNTFSGAETAKPLNNAEIYQLFSNNSWMWKDGAGYFSVPKRQFKAWSGSGKSATYADGIWFITEPGKLCFRANWHTVNSVVPATTCFSHRKKDGVIFQRREPKGEWYVFKHAPAQKSDEIRKLRSGDYVSKHFDTLKIKLATN